VYVSLAVADIEEGDDASAQLSAERAVQMEPNYLPGHFTAGVAAMLNADAPTAERELAAALNLGGAPSRTQYFLGTLRAREGDTHPSPSP